MRTLRSQVRWIMFAIVVLFILSIFGMYGFNNPRRSPSKSEDYVVAEIDGKAVMRSTLDEQVRSYVDRANVRDITSADIPLLYQATLENMAVVARLSKEAKDSGLKASEEEINAAVKEVSDQFPTKEAFMQYLDQSGIKMSAFRERMTAQVVQQKLMKAAIGSPEAKEEEVKDFYEKTKLLLFHSPAGFTMDFVRFKNAEEAKRVLASLEAGIEWKNAVGEVVSADVIEKNPETGPVFVPESSFKERLAPLADLGIDQVSPAIELASNDILIAVKREQVKEKTAPFEEVSGDVKSIFLKEKEREAQTKFFKGLKERTNIVIHDPVLFPKPAQKSDAVGVNGQKSGENPEPVSGDEEK